MDSEEGLCYQRWGLLGYFGTRLLDEGCQRLAECHPGANFRGHSFHCHYHPFISALVQTEPKPESLARCQSTLTTRHCRFSHAHHFPTQQQFPKCVKKTAQKFSKALTIFTIPVRIIQHQFDSFKAIVFHEFKWVNIECCFTS